MTKKELKDRIALGLCTACAGDKREISRYDDNGILLCIACPDKLKSHDLYIDRLREKRCLDCGGFLKGVELTCGCSFPSKYSQKGVEEWMQGKKLE